MAAFRKEIDLNLCKGCGICIDICPKEVYDRDPLGNPSWNGTKTAFTASNACCIAPISPLNLSH